MAREVGCVCYAACVAIFAFNIQLTDSANSRDFDVKYSVFGLRHDFHTEVRSIEDTRLLRVKRQQPPVSLNSTTSNSSSFSNGSDSAVGTTEASVTVPTTQAPVSTSAQPTPSSTPRPQTPAVTTEGREGSNITSLPIIQDNHNYYRSSIYPEYVDDYFVELDSPNTQGTLNSGHRLAVTIALPFQFRFYGHNITNVTVATGGFIYMSPFLHQWLTATQYIAPLMANFETSSSDDSNIFYKQIGNEFVIEWHNVKLKDQSEAGPFVFQAKLKNDGTITFVYKTLPLPVRNISGANHPVKIGLSDAFYNDTFLPEYGIKRRTIIEYHRVDFSKEQIEEGTVIVLNPLPTCNIISDCGTCAEHTGVKFDCKWCDQTARCSDGLDWYRQEWESKGCKSTAFNNSLLCSKTAIPTTNRPVTKSSIPVSTAPVSSPPKALLSQPKTADNSLDASADDVKDDCLNSNSGSCEINSKGNSVAAIVAVVLVLVVLFGSAAGWVLYAYTHPTSAAGMWLMEHRPSQMKTKLANMKFWKKSSPAGTKYAVESEA